VNYFLTSGYQRDNSKIDIKNIKIIDISNNYSFGITYGLTDNSELKASFDISQSTISNSINSDEVISDWQKGYNIGLTYRDKFDSSKSNQILESYLTPNIPIFFKQFTHILQHIFLY
jgi:hypothetical protein